jgi:methyl coenzyme M reductase alpha subunit
MFLRTALLIAASVAAMSAVPAAGSAEVLKFHVALDGKSGPEPTGSPATGSAKVRVDTVTHRVSVDLDVSGITIDDLWDKLVAAPVGPIHFHKYATAAGGDSVLALPLPYGPDYHAEKWGLKVRMKNYDYVAGAALVKSTLSFDDFVAGMKSGLIVLNVHTDQFNPGEISGLVVPG